jgi:hypothetical protein
MIQILLSKTDSYRSPIPTGRWPANQGCSLRPLLTELPVDPKTEIERVSPDAGKSSIAIVMEWETARTLCNCRAMEASIRRRAGCSESW